LHYWQIPSWNTTAWSCGTDANTTYNAGTGLDLSGTTFSVEPTYRLPQSCSMNQIAKWNGSAWACQADQGLTQISAPIAEVSGSISIPAGGAAKLITDVTAPSSGNYLVIASVQLLSDNDADEFSSVECTAGGTTASFGSVGLNNQSVLTSTLIGATVVLGGSKIPLTCGAAPGAAGIVVSYATIVAVKLN
jgi:hypothetical protein